MAITAFPVLARILAERGLQRNQVGTLSLSCAAINDVVAWCVLAVVVVISAGTSSGLARTLIGSVVFLGVLVGFLRPAVVRLVDSRWAARQSRSVLVALAVIGTLAGAAATSWIGLHAVFGAFAVGVIVPRRRAEAVVPDLGRTLEQLSLVLLPVFFVITGLNVDLRGLGVDGVLALLLVIPAACLGKLVGAAGAAWVAGFGLRQATAVGLLMNTRGLTELIILTVGLQLGVLDPTLFAVMVVMALVTTVMAGPLLQLVYPPHLRQADTVTDAPPPPAAGPVPR